MRTMVNFENTIQAVKNYNFPVSMELEHVQSNFE